MIPDDDGLGKASNQSWDNYFKQMCVHGIVT